MSTAPQSELARLRSHGDATEMALWAGRSERERHRLDAVRGAGRRPLEQRMRAILRCPAAHRGYQRLVETPAHSGPKAYAVGSWDQFLSFISHHRRGPFWLGLSAVHRFGGGNGGTLYIGGRVGCRSAGGRILIASALVKVGTTWEDSAAAAQRRATDCARNRGLGEIDVLEMGFDGQPLGVALTALQPAEGSLSQLLGPDGCRHPRGAWKADREARAMALSCPDCLRERVACEPLHRLPVGHPLRDPLETEEGVHDYLEAQADHDRARGVPVCADLEGLLARDGLCSLDPTLYSQGRRGAHVRPGLTVGQLMSRR